MGARQGVALNTDECLKRKGFQIEGPPALRRNVTPLKHKTYSLPPCTPADMRTSYRISGEYARGRGRGCHACDGARQLPHETPTCAFADLQGCQRCVCVCAHTHRACLHTQMHQEAAQPSLQPWHQAKTVTRRVSGNACTQRHQGAHVSGQKFF